MHSFSLWNNGPPWLTLPVGQWPTWAPTTALIIEAEQHIHENLPIQTEIALTPADNGIHNVINTSRHTSEYAVPRHCVRSTIY